MFICNIVIIVVSKQSMGHKKSGVGEGVRAEEEGRTDPVELNIFWTPVSNVTFHYRPQILYGVESWTVARPIQKLNPFLGQKLFDTPGRVAGCIILLEYIGA